MTYRDAEIHDIINMSARRHSLARKLVIFGINSPIPDMSKYPKVRIAECSLSRKIERYCDENFGDNWIWSSSRPNWSSPLRIMEWTDLYFKEPEDALLFNLAFNTVAT